MLCDVMLYDVMQASYVRSIYIMTDLPRKTWLERLDRATLGNVITTYLLHEGGPYHIETSLLIFSANQWTGFYIIGSSVIKEVYPQ